MVYMTAEYWVVETDAMMAGWRVALTVELKDDAMVETMVAELVVGMVD
jgi:hypothetical protein